MHTSEREFAAGRGLLHEAVKELFYVRRQSVSQSADAPTADATL